MSRECCFPDLHSRARIICQREKMESQSRSQNIIRQEYVKEQMGHDSANRKHFLLFDLHIYWLAYRSIRCLLIQFNEMKDDHRSYIRNFCSCKKKAWKKFRLVRDSNPWPLRYRCSALTIKLTSQLGAGRWTGSLWTRERMMVKLWIYENHICELRSE